MVYKGVKLDCGYRLDIVVRKELILEIKAIEKLLPVHIAQLVTYLRLRGISRGLLLNFGEALMRDGIKRVANNYKQPDSDQ